MKQILISYEQWRADNFSKYANTIEAIDAYAIELRKNKSNKDNVYDQLNRVLAACAKYYNLSVEMLLSRCRKRATVDARQLYCYLASELVKSATLSDIGRVSNLDHSTVVHSKKQIVNFLSISNVPTMCAIECVTEMLLGYDNWYRQEIEGELFDCIMSKV